MPHAHVLVNSPFVTRPGDGTDNAAVIVGDLHIGAHQRQVDVSDLTVHYIGYAHKDETLAGLGWRIYRVQLNAGFHWLVAEGAWDNRAALGYT